MRLFLAPLPVLFAFLASPATGDEKPDTAADLKALVAKWKIEKAELGGKDILEHLKDMKFEITAGGKYTAQVGEEKDAGSFTIDTSKTPKELDVKPTGGPGKGKTMKAIYKLDGDTLAICYEHDTDSGKRPEKFETKAGTTQLLIVYKRMK
jgi:uncharacterized protein (TIGR03067 family)